MTHATFNGPFKDFRVQVNVTYGFSNTLSKVRYNAVQIVKRLLNRQN